jgi:uncharacterized damage-inducible protein DinB
MDDPRYPVGRYKAPPEVSPEQRREWIAQIAEAPARLRAAVEGLDEGQLDTPYRDGGWTVRQVVHHVPESHMNAYVRFKLALTEDSPVIKTYEEAEWAALDDVRQTPIELSLTLLDALHARWLTVLDSLDESQWQRTFRHSEWGAIRIDQTLGLYAWHGRHHVAHVTGLRERRGW